MATLQDWMQKAQIADDGKPGKSLEETSTDELKATLAKIKPTDAGAQARISAIKAELKKRGGDGGMDKGCGSMHKAKVEIEINGEEEDNEKEMEKAKGQPSQSTSLSPEKARQMLHERSGGHGRPITEQQRKFFGAIGGHLPAPGGKAKKSMAESLDDWLEKATPIGGITPGGYKRVKKDEYVKVTKEQHAAHTAKEAEEAKAGGDNLFDMFFTPEGEKKMAEERAKYEAAEKPISVTAQVAKMLKEKASDEDILDVLGDVPKNTLLRMDFGAIGTDQQGRELPKSRATIRKTANNTWELHNPTAEQKEDFTQKPLTDKNIVHLLTKMGSAGAAPAGERPIPEPKKEEPKEAKPAGPEDLKPTKLEPQGKPKAAKPKKLSDTHAKVLASAEKFQAITPGGSFATYKQVDKLVENGLLEAAGRGQYKLTDAGKEALNTGKFTAPMKKSEVDMTLSDWLQKSGGLPTHAPCMGCGKSMAVEGGSADGGDLSDVGRTSGSSDSKAGPGTDAGTGQVICNECKAKQKLSDDDADEEKQMSPHKKPIETVRKSRFPADQRASVAHETAVRVSQLQKSDDVYVGPSGHPLSEVRQHGGVDDAASELVKSEGFYHGRSPQSARPAVPLGQGVLCKSIHAGGCDETYSAALTACPGCGAGTVGHRVLPGAVIMGAESRILEKSEGPGSLLRRPPQEPDIKIGE